MQIGSYILPNRCLLAPMAGVTDRPFRQLCRKLGAGYAVSEMISCNPLLRESRKSEHRSNHNGEPAPIAVQIAGSDPLLMAEAAQYNVSKGAQIIDINMGCPAKKVCRKQAGSALLGQPALVADIITEVVNAVSVPVSVKIRTGISPDQRNGVTIARIAEDCGAQALTVHGRTRACMYKGAAEYDTIAAIKQNIGIPLIANGDLETPKQVESVLRYTGADAVMIGRAAQGNPWIFDQVNQYLSSGITARPPTTREILDVMLSHLRNLHEFYGGYAGVRIARKHIGWYLAGIDGGELIRRQLMSVEDPVQQLEVLEKALTCPVHIAA